MSSRVNLVDTGYMKHGKANGTFHWEIDNFSQLCPETATHLRTTWSPIFFLGQRDDKNLEWVSGVSGSDGYIRCFFVQLNDENEIVVGDDKPKFVSCSYKIGLGNENNPFVVSNFEMGHFNTMSKYSYSEYQPVIKISDLYRRREELLQEDTLRITIQMEVYPEDPSADLPHVFKDLFNVKFSDVQIKCGEFFFPCHKLILSSRSSVLNRMIESGLEEPVNGQRVLIIAAHRFCHSAHGF